MLIFTHFGGMMAETKRKEEKGRIYQIALLNLAIEENVIICLPTGAGKTFIAVELARHFLPDAIKENKKIVFLANTLPLVHQQAKYFRERIGISYGNDSGNQIREFMGDMKEYSWKKPKWDREIEAAEILAMPPDILWTALQHKCIPFSKINLIILDECHHAVKNHPMAKIMKKYKGKIRKDPNCKLPRILGLTATIIKGNPKDDNIPAEVRAMEEKLHCKAVTYRDYEEVLRHSTTANVLLRPYIEALNSMHEITTYMANQIALLEIYENIVVDSREELVEQINHHTLTHAAQMFNKKKTVLEELTKAIRSVKKVGEELGPYAMRLAACIKIGFLQLTDVEEELLQNLTTGATTTLSRVIGEVDLLMSSQTKSEQIQTFITEKVKELFNIFLQWKESNEHEELCAIVFCTKRLTAQILNWIFQDAREHCGDKFKFMKPAFVVGCSGTHSDVHEQRITNKKQEDVIEKFHRKEINLVFATDVLEEGLNVPSCNLIVRFDCFRTYPSFIQSMGRARQKNALYYVLTSDEQDTRDILDKYSVYRTELAEHLKNNARHLDVDENYDENTSQMPEDSNDIVPLVKDPKDLDSPTITLADAVPKVYSYCQTLSCDKIVVLQPYSWCTRVIEGEDEGMFKAYVQLPTNALVRGITEGIARRSKNVAKRAAFLEVCKRLHARGAFDDNFFPLIRRIPPHIAKFKYNEEEVKYIDGKKVGTQKHTQWYSKKIPDVIDKSTVRGVILNVFEIRIKLTKPMTELDDRIRFFQFENKRHVFAILSRQNLEEIPPVKLESHYGFFESTYVKVNLKEMPRFEEEKILKLKDFQRFIFSQTLSMSHSIMKYGESDPFLIAALIKDNNDEWDINWSLINAMKNLDEFQYREQVLEEERCQMSFSAEDYQDAVVVPWHREHTELPVIINQGHLYHSRLIFSISYSTYGKNYQQYLNLIMYRKLHGYLHFITLE